MMAKKKDDTTIEFEHNGKKTGPYPIDTFRKAVDIIKGLSVVSFLEGESELIDEHLKRLIKHLTEHPESDVCKLNITLLLSVDEGKIQIHSKTKSTIPNTMEHKRKVGVIDIDDGQLKLFDD